MAQGISLLVFPVKDIGRAKTLYAKLLDTEPYTDAAYYVGFRAGGQEIGLHPGGHREGLTGPVAYWPVDDIEKHLKALLQAGAEIQQDIKDVGGGRRIAIVRDPDGNSIGLMQSP